MELQDMGGQELTDVNGERWVIAYEYAWPQIGDLPVRVFEEADRPYYALVDTLSARLQLAENRRPILLKKNFQGVAPKLSVENLKDIAVNAKDYIQICETLKEKGITTELEYNSVPDDTMGRPKAEDLCSLKSLARKNIKGWDSYSKTDSAKLADDMKIFGPVFGCFESIPSLAFLNETMRYIVPNKPKPVAQSPTQGLTLYESMIIGYGVMNKVGEAFGEGYWLLPNEGDLTAKERGRVSDRCFFGAIAPFVL